MFNLVLNSNLSDIIFIIKITLLRTWPVAKENNREHPRKFWCVTRV